METARVIFDGISDWFWDNGNEVLVAVVAAAVIGFVAFLRRLFRNRSDTPVISPVINVNTATNEQSLVIVTPKKPSPEFNLGEVCYEDSDYQGALEHYEKALKKQEEISGEGSEDVVCVHNALGIALWKMARYDEAIEHFNYGRAICYGKNDSDSAMFFHNLAFVFYEKGEYEESLRWSGKALTIFETVYGKDHPDTANVYNNMANVYYEQGDYDKALEFYGKALAIRETVLGKNHPNTADTYNNMAVVYDYKGDYDKALEFYGKALAIYEKVLGENHSVTAMTYNNMACVYDTQGDYDKALGFYGKALAIYEKVHGEKHPDTAMTYYNIAILRCKQGDYAEALTLAAKAYRVFLSKLGETHPYTTKSADLLRKIHAALKIEQPFDNWLNSLPAADES